MALQLLPPPPNTALVDEPQRDSIWRRWLEQLFVRMADAGQIDHNTLNNLQGGTTNQYYHLTAAQHSTVTSFGTFNANRVLVTGPTSSITTTDDLQYSIATSTLAAINVSTLGTLTAGNASSDAFIINAGTWTYGSNWAATRAAGAVAAGTVNLTNIFSSASGDSGGTSNIRGFTRTISVSGANNIAQVTGTLVTATNAATGTTAVQYANLFSCGLTSSGPITTAIGCQGGLFNTGSANIVNGAGFFVSSPNIASTGAITTNYGYYCSNLGHATLVTNAIGYQADNMTASATLTVSFRSQQNSGTGVWGFLHTGTANNAFNGNVRIGSGTVAPTVALDVTGFGIFSGNVSSAAFIPTSTAVPTHGLYQSAVNEVSLSTVSTKGLTLTSTRTLYGTALHNNAGPVTGTTNQYIASGTYTPTISSIANLDAVTSFAAQWIRVGNVVNVSGKVQIDPTAPATLTRLGFSLPIASNLANQEDCAGTAFATGIAGQGAGIRAEVTNDQAEMAYISGDVTVQPMMYIYQYEVL